MFGLNFKVSFGAERFRYEGRVCFVSDSRSFECFPMQKSASKIYTAN